MLEWQARRRRDAGSWFAAASMLALLSVLLAAGCGGRSDKKANEAYANGVCTAIGDWEQEIKSITASLTLGETQASLETKVTQAETATETLVTKIKAVPAPDTSEGQAAKQQLDQLTTDIDSTANAAKAALTQLQGDPSAGTMSIVIAAITPQIQNLANETKTAISTLKSAGGDLASAFKSTDSCQSLG